MGIAVVKTEKGGRCVYTSAFLDLPILPCLGGTLLDGAATVPPLWRCPLSTPSASYSG